MDKTVTEPEERILDTLVRYLKGADEDRVRQVLRYKMNDILGHIPYAVGRILSHCSDENDYVTVTCCIDAVRDVCANYLYEFYLAPQED